MYTAVPVVAFLAWQLVPMTILGLDGWRWVVIIGSIGAVVIWWIRRNSAGIAALAGAAWPHGRSRRIVAEMEAACTRGNRPRTAAARNGRRRNRTQGRRLDRDVERDLSRPHHHAGGFSAFQTIGYYGFNSWVPALLVSQGIEVTKSLVYTFIIAIAAPVGPLIGIFLRRPLRAQMADRLGGHRHRRFRLVVRAADDGGGRDRLRLC